MNKRLLAYLRSIGLASDATDEQAWEFYRGLRGTQGAIANALNYQEDDTAGRTNCDLMLRSLGFDPENPTQVLAVERQSAGTDGASQAGDLERANEEAAATERARVSAIMEMAGSEIPSETVQMAIREGWSPERAGREFLRHFRESNRGSVSHDGAPAIHSRNSVSGINRETLECALLHRANIDPTRTYFRHTAGGVRPANLSDEAIQRAIDDSYRFRDAALMDIVRMAAAIDGINTGAHVGRDELFQELRARAFSTSALSAIFTTNMSSQLLSAYEATADTTTGGWVRESDVSNFKMNERPRLTKGPNLTRLPRGSEADHAEFSDVVEQYKIARYAQQFVVDEQDIIDDTFGGINQHTPAEIGEAARQLRPDLVYSILLGNPTMRDNNPLFDANNHGNLVGSAALTLTTLSAARAAMATQQENGRNLDLTPSFLIVSKAGHDNAIEITDSGIVIAGDANTLRGAFNSQSRSGLTIVSDPRIDNGVTDPTDPTGATVHSGVATTWFLAAMAGRHTIEVGYRSGTGRRPQMRTFVLTQGKWGIGWDINMDIGAKALDWRGLSKQQVAAL